MSDQHLYRQILGIRFFVGSAEQAVRRGQEGGLVVAPAAPLLTCMPGDPATREALLKADLAITDSGLMVLLWKLRTGERLERVSGLQYLQRFMREPVFSQPGETFWIMPSAAAQERNLAWLRAGGFPANAEDHYVAPIYGEEIDDPALVERIKARRPSQVFIGLGGGTQERLGLFLLERLAHRPGIHCLGAAIGFLNGDQGQIPGWADRFFLGWLLRCVRQPRRFVPRYWRAVQLLPMLLRYGSQMPPGGTDP